MAASIVIVTLTCTLAASMGKVIDTCKDVIASQNKLIKDLVRKTG